MAVMLTMMLAVCIKAQNTDVTYKVRGEVVDSLTLKGEPYATISIFRKGAGDKPVAMAVTDLNGKFNVESKGEGTYVFTISSMGRNTIRRTFEIGAERKTINMGRLLITDSRTELKGVEVVAYKPLVKADIDKLSYSVVDDPESKTVNAIDMLKKVPMVTVDGQDNIKVNGSTSFKVYVNGKPNNMMSNNPSEVLKSMPASSIKKIEVITNPGPKYDAEGVGGILNIITEGKGLEGYTATVSLSGSNTGGGGGVYATVKERKLTVSVNYNNSIQDNKKNYSDTERSVTDANGVPTTVTKDSRTTAHHGIALPEPLFKEGEQRCADAYPGSCLWNRSLWIFERHIQQGLLQLRKRCCRLSALFQRERPSAYILLPHRVRPADQQTAHKVSRHVCWRVMDGFHQPHKESGHGRRPEQYGAYLSARLYNALCQAPYV